MSQCRSRSPGHFAVVLDSSLTFGANYVHVAVTLKDPHSTVPLSSLQVFDLGADLVHVLLEDLPKSKARQRQHSVTRRSCQLTHHSDRKYHPHLIFTTESKRGKVSGQSDICYCSSNMKCVIPCNPAAAQSAYASLWFHVFVIR